MTTAGPDDSSNDECEICDATLRSLKNGVGTLKLDGLLKGYLASIVGQMTFPSTPWPWFVVVWLDGTKEPSFEDHGPRWWTVRELEAGKFEHPLGPGTATRKRFLGILPYTSIEPGPEVTFEFAWLPPSEAAAKWEELGLNDSDF